MESKDRLYVDAENKMFIPMGMDGAEYKTKWLTTPKIITLVCSIIVLILLPVYLSSRGNSLISILLIELVAIVIDSFALRYIVFEEKMYYRWYSEMQRRKKANEETNETTDEIVNPAELWAIPSVDDTADGAILNYRDGHIGVVVKLVKGMIIGRGEEFEAQHYSCISDAIKSLITNGYRWSYMNDMETSENDVRLSSMDRLVNASSNLKINELTSMQIGYLKRISNKTYSEVEYLIIRTKKYIKKDQIIEDILSSLQPLTDGGYDDIEVLKFKEVNNLFKEYNGITFFNPNEVYLSSNAAYGTVIPFVISKIHWDDDTVQSINKSDKENIKHFINDVENGVASKKKFKDIAYRYESGVKISGTNGDSYINPDNFEEEEYIDI